MKAVVATIGVAVLSPLLLAGTAAVAAAGGGAASAAHGDCAGEAGSVDAEAVAKQVKDILGGKGGGKVSVEGLELPAEQIPNAKTIVATGVAMHIPERGQIVALATAMQESRLRNLNYGDLDSLGLFQQRPSAGWGTPAQVRDPVYASTKFYKALLEVRGWESMTVTQAAQAVQRSAFPDAYAQWEPLARALQSAIVKTLPDGGKSKPEDGKTADKDKKDKNNSTTGKGGCATGADGSNFGTIPPGAVPKGYAIPKDAPKKIQTAIRWALGQLDTPYQWGGTCENSHGPDPMGRCDCSSLMQMAYHAAGVNISRTTYTQVNEGKAVSVSSLKPGDLLFTRGTAAVPEHVGMYIGSGLIINAPKTGDVVRITTLANWKPQILAARRILN
ncbi:C40 family peptidase [Streptomyces sp. UNOC14_S4]|uniref:C40 family peptidase n=1 Tax=Streptomyces sp. UNOC14_S4 TaxID=2872340 RepID=UPI001E5314CB|nr:C40 family peptidase [Streptomyces sp. UNOC14_S4]MCC3771532.1 C40 family peptidase [Streptomyces sp. UNOC14_S4]